MRSLVLIVAIAAFPQPNCSDACVERVKERQFAESHGGCRDRRCVARVRYKQTLRAIREVAVYRCSFGRSAIPCSIAWCESHGSWAAYNPSGARGRYQFLGWPVPWPVRTKRDELAHHRMAARLWNGGRGAGHWAQCL